MADPLFTTDDLTLAFDGDTEMQRRLAGDDGTGQPRADRVAYGIAVASEEGYGILMSGFDTIERVQRLAANDIAVRHALCMIWRETLAQGKDEFRLPDGTTVFSPDARKGRDLLREKARGARRTSAEQVTPNGPGQSGLLRPRASHTQSSVLRDPATGKMTGF